MRFRHFGHLMLQEVSEPVCVPSVLIVMRRHFFYIPAHSLICHAHPHQVLKANNTKLLVELRRLLKLLQEARVFVLL